MWEHCAHTGRPSSCVRFSTIWLRPESCKASFVTTSLSERSCDVDNATKGWPLGEQDLNSKEMGVSPLGASPHPREQKLLAHILLERPVLVARQNQVSQSAAERKRRIWFDELLPRCGNAPGLNI